VFEDPACHADVPLLTALFSVRCVWVVGVVGGGGGSIGAGCYTWGYRYFYAPHLVGHYFDCIEI
jgi:hypothetical protein